MEYITRSESPFDGTVTAFYFQSGELVTDGAQLLEVEPLAVADTADAKGEEA
jgi:3-methylcrotonyl-CoA carboxylase alpha subunit